MPPTSPPAWPRSPRYGDAVELTIARLGPKGEGEATLDLLVGPQREPRTFLVDVRKAMVGDRVRAIVDGRHRRRLSARLDEVLAPSPDRIAPRCPHFGPREEPNRGCGGCTLQALAYPAQLEVKRGLIRRAMEDQGLDPDLVAPVRGADAPWEYRNKMEFSFGDDRERRFALGLYPTGWHNEVLSLTTCHLVSPATAGLVPRVRAWAEALGLAPYRARADEGFLRNLIIRDGKRTDERLVELVTTPDAVVATIDGPRPAEEVAAAFAEAVTAAAADLGGRVTSVYWTVHHAVAGQPSRLEERHLAGEPVYHDVLALPGGRSLRFAIHPRAFFQPNPRQAEVLVAEVLARLGDARVVLDLYCGTGTLGLCVAASGARVVGVELVADAIANARANAEANGLLDATEWLVGDVGEVLEREREAPWRAALDAVVVDPPRAGLAPRAIAELIAIGAPRIVYVSCSPTSLARDLAALRDGGYAIAGPITPVDLFPHTHHVENVVALDRTPT